MNEQTTTYRVTFTAETTDMTFSSRAIIAQDYVGTDDGNEIWDFTTDAPAVLARDLDADASVISYKAQ